MPGTGYDFADFLLGLPQQTSVQFGQNNHFRGNFWDLYAQDEWKMRGNLTLNLGVRYEYVSPLTELNNRIANLDLSPGVSESGAGHAGGDARSARTSRALQRQPARQPGAARSQQLRAAHRLCLEAVFENRGARRIRHQLQHRRVSEHRAATGLSAAVLHHGDEYSDRPGRPDAAKRISGANAGITNNYAVNPNYRLGYVQIRNLDIQQQIRPTLLLNIDYTGTKGTDLDILEAPEPNRDRRFAFPAFKPSPTKPRWRIRRRMQDRCGCASGCRRDSRSAASTRFPNRSMMHLRSAQERPRASSTPGLGAGGTGAGAAAAGQSARPAEGASNVAQNAFDLSAERGLSSFNQTHKFTADYLWELPLDTTSAGSPDNTPLRAIFGDWQWSGDWTIASGLPFTPRLLGNIADVNRGTNGTLRPDLVPGQSVSLANPSIAEWFNTAAFVAPPTGQYGNARRNSIIGPGSKVFDMAFTKIIPLKESRVLEFRAQATNIFNIPNYSSIDTTVNSPTFGRVTAVGAMRQFTMTARFRF